MAYPVTTSVNLTYSPNTAVELRMRACNGTSCTSFTNTSDIMSTLPVLGSVALQPEATTIAVSGTLQAGSGDAPITNFSCATDEAMSQSVAHSSTLDLSVVGLDCSTNYTVWCKVHS